MYFVNSLNKKATHGADASTGGSGCGPLLARDFFFIPPQQGKSRSKGGRSAPSAPIPPSFAATLALAF
ncbi:hypothetical protein QP794_33095 [Paenibacillus sp. UMB7766-LJ446]|uniref:hypothetical protein n=1 Tax=Paenibacillus sp. UMB7766-LJ446 TaxID=3046313 RepID=UPI00254BEEA0|nr:hypothetical protein [Paenibacillus sp. UMB7766-LJ446]MDK8194912.1 hypothetical protein [Paenibacillus sp. UMB7766-LJ446]